MGLNTMHCSATTHSPSPREVLADVRDALFHLGATEWIQECRPAHIKRIPQRLVKIAQVLEKRGAGQGLIEQCLKLVAEVNPTERLASGETVGEYLSREKTDVDEGDPLEQGGSEVFREKVKQPLRRLRKQKKDILQASAIEVQREVIEEVRSRLEDIERELRELREVEERLVVGRGAK